MYTDLLSFLQKHPNYNIQEYFDLLSHLSTCPPLSPELFYTNLKSIMSMGTIIVAYDNNRIIASGTVIIEPKIIRAGKCVGHIEDIVVHPQWRGRGIAQDILQKLKDYAISNNCYKIILDCNDAVSNVYAKSGFHVSGLYMSNYL